MTDRELRKCFKCGGQRVYLERPEKTLADGSKKRAYRFQCLDCGAILFSYQWLVDPDRYTGPSYLDEIPDPKGC
jgi:hypothetical protein